MESLIAASESFYNKSKEEEANLELFNSFMKKKSQSGIILVLQESIISHCLSMIKKYYFDMKSRRWGKMY